MIVVVGLSHRTAPIEVREKAAILPDEIAEVLRELVTPAEVGEAMLISTCNRLEIVAAGPSLDASQLEPVIEHARGLFLRRAPESVSCLYVRSGAEAVKHLFRVTASLDSLVLGEPQILGQVKDAFETARRVGTLGPALHRAVPRALRAAKRARSETSIGSGQVSVPSVAVDLARQIFGELASKTAVLVGSGDMAESVARLLRGDGTRLSVVGRNATKTDELARAVGGVARSLSELEAALADADVVISSTSAPSHVVDLQMVERSRRARRGKSTFFIDLAVPRDIDPRVDRLDGVFVYNIDDFEQVVADALSGRRREAERAEQIVADAVRGWERWAEAEQATPMIVALRGRLRAILIRELDRSMKTKLKHLGSDERQVLERMIEAALNKMLHGPTVRLRDAASDAAPDPERLERLSAMLTDLFALDQDLGELKDEELDDPMQALAPSPSEETERSVGQEREDPLDLGGNRTARAAGSR